MFVSISCYASRFSVDFILCKIHFDCFEATQHNTQQIFIHTSHLLFAVAEKSFSFSPFDGFLCVPTICCDLRMNGMPLILLHFLLVSLYPTRFIRSAHFIVDPHTFGVNVFTAFPLFAILPQFHLRLFHHLYDQNGLFARPFGQYAGAGLFLFILSFFFVYVFVSTAFNAK